MFNTTIEMKYEKYERKLKAKTLITQQQKPEFHSSSK